MASKNAKFDLSANRAPALVVDPHKDLEKFERKFAELYISSGGDKIFSAKNCGHGTNKTPGTIATHCMLRPEVKAYIAQLMNDREIKSDLTPENVLKEMSRIAFCDVTNVVKVIMKPIAKDVDPETGEEVVMYSKTIDVALTEELNEDQRAAIKEVYLDRNGNVRVKFYDKMNALGDLAKHFSLLNPDIKDENTTHNTQVNIYQMSNEMSSQEASNLYADFMKNGTKVDVIDE